MALPDGARSIQEAFDNLGKRLRLRVSGVDATPAPGAVVIFARLNGSNKTELVVQHPTGAEEVISTEP
jgi:hypothetical protein